MTAIKTAAFTSANDGSDVSDYAEVGGPSQEAARFFVDGSESTGSPVIELALVDVSGGVTTVLGRFRATCTISAKRSGSDGASGQYVCDVEFDEGGTSKFDLLGHTSDQGSSTAKWKVGVPDLASHTTVNVYWAVTQEV